MDFKIILDFIRKIRVDRVDIASLIDKENSIHLSLPIDPPSSIVEIHLNGVSITSLRGVHDFVQMSVFT